MAIKPLYIFDLDGTLALIEHRLKYVQRKVDEQDWDSFYAECISDAPNRPVIETLNALRTSGNDIWVVSGRSDSVRVQTIEWLIKYTELQTNELTDQTLIMRPHKNHTKDTELKSQFYSQMQPCDKDRLVAVFEDRNRIVKMWRDFGVACFQVAVGLF